MGEWSKEMENRLIKMHKEGWSIKTIAKEIGKTKGAVSGMCHKLRQKGVLSKKIKPYVRSDGSKVTVRRNRSKPARHVPPVSSPHPVSLEEAGAPHCRYPVSQTMYCGNPIERNSYCEAHYKICYQPPKNKETENDA